MPGTNIIMFMPETLRADAVFGNGGRRARTPNFDALGDEGVRFTSCYAQHSVCTPSRCSMFTGLYPHTAGRRTLGTLIRPHEHNLFRDLKEAGYETIVVGKNDMMFPETARASFDRWNIASAPRNSGSPYPHKEGDRLYYSFLHGCAGDTDYHDGDQAGIDAVLEYLDVDHAKPFCILIALSYVHPPYACAEPFYSMYDRDKMPEPYVADVDSKRRYVRMIREQYGLDAVTDDEWLEIRAVYLGMVSRTDHQLGQVMDKLKSRGLWNDTALFMFSDHGDFVGDYGLVEKWFSATEDCILRVPMIMRVPGQDGVDTRNCLVEMVDLYPTILDVAGINDNHYHFGKSLLPLHDANRPDEHRKLAFSEGGHNPDEAYIHDIQCPYGGVYLQKHSLWKYDHTVIAKSWMVRNERYKYVYCPDEIDELYDMKANPGETVNIVDEPAHAGLVRQMRDSLLEWLSRTADQIPEDENRCGWPEGGV